MKMTKETDRELAERMYRAEHPRNPLRPFERQAQLSDLWPADQEEYIRQCAALRDILERQSKRRRFVHEA